MVVVSPERTKTYLVNSQKAEEGEAGSLVIGNRVGSLREILSHGHGETGLGRIGGFVARRNARDWSSPLGLTCAHVLNHAGAGVGDPVFRPRLIDGPDGLLLPQTGLDPIGSITAAGFTGIHRYAYPGDQPRPYYLDCGLFELSAAALRPAAGARLTRPARAHPADLRPGQALPVRLVGMHGQTAGRIVDVAADIEQEHGQSCPNTLVIESLPGQPPFAAVGDSGALVADVLDHPVGLLWGVDLGEPRRVFACHLLPVLDRLGAVLSRFTRIEISPCMGSRR